MKKRRLLFATKVGGQLYMCEGGRKEKGGKGQYVPSRTRVRLYSKALVQNGCKMAWKYLINDTDLALEDVETITSSF